jgi:hypothetical protein
MRRTVMSEEEVPELPSWVRPAELTLEILLIAIGALMLVRWWWRTHIWRRSRDLDLRERLDEFNVPHTSIGLFDGAAIRGKVRPLGSSATDQMEKLDMTRTATATAREAGCFQPVFAERARSRSNVVLLEQVGAYDHSTNLFVFAANRLRQEAPRLFYDGFSRKRAGTS